MTDLLLRRMSQKLSWVHCTEGTTLLGTITSSIRCNNTQLATNDYTTDLSDIRAKMSVQINLTNRHFSRHKTMISLVKEKRAKKVWKKRTKSNLMLKRTMNIAVYYAVHKRKQLLAQKCTPFKDCALVKYMSEWKSLISKPDFQKSNQMIIKYRRYLAWFSKILSNNIQISRNFRSFLWLFINTWRLRQNGRHLQMHFLEWKCLNFDKDFT